MILGIPFIGEAQIIEENIAPYREEIIKEGVKITLSIDHVDDQKTSGLFREGDDVRFRFLISDALSGREISGVFPAAWVDPVPEVDNSCIEKVSPFLGGSILNKPELDLNGFHVLSLNTEPSITVIDPWFGYGKSKLLTLIKLNSPGMDWVVSKDQNFVFVSMPESKQIAVISTVSWEVVDNIDVPAPPYKLSIQANGQYLWAACQGDKNNGEFSGLAIIEVSTKKINSFIPGDDGMQDLLIREDDRFVYVSNKKENKVTVVDAHYMKPVQVLTIQQPSSIAYSDEAGALYVISETEGGLTVIDGEEHKVINFAQLQAGICQIKFEPTQRFAFIVNSREDHILILDAFTNQLVQVGVESEPDQVSFTKDLAYVRHRKSELILMVPLANLGNEGLPMSTFSFPGGQDSPGQMTLSCLANGIVQAPDESAVLVANALDDMVYYYKEGMAAPMGSFGNYNQKPRAVLMIDRSLQEVSPGSYETVARLKSKGMHDVVFFMDVPRHIHCFRINILPDPMD